MTHTELIELRDNNQLVEGNAYTVTDYENFNITMTATSSSTFAPISTSDNNQNLIYDVDNNTIKYMQDTNNHIEGYFDWTNNVVGNNVYIFFQNSNTLTVTNSSYVTCNNNCSGSIESCSNIIVGDSEVDLNNCNFIKIGDNSIVAMTDCDNININNDTKISLTDNIGVSVYDECEDLTINGSNIIGSRNLDITINGDSNIITSDNWVVDINGDCNNITNSKYITISNSGSFNNITDTQLVTIDEGYTNDIVNSNEIYIETTNNNIVETKEITITDRPAFLDYKTQDDVIRVNNIVENINMQADNDARILIIDQQKFRDEQPYISGDTYEITNGDWTIVNNL